ncbi:MAG TPA: EAL domain-containing protein [Acidimicrobiales bacterium]|nr:EAL domain-containing protein [Acidimicrobiales bacterium]
MAFAGLVCLSAAVALLTTQHRHPLRFTDSAGFRIGTVLLVVGLAAYVMEKERHLRRLAKLLTDERVLAAALSNRLKELALLYDAGKAMNSVLRIDDVLTLILSSALELLEASRGSIMLVEPDGMTVACQAGDLATLAEFTPAIATWVVTYKEPLLIQAPEAKAKQPDDKSVMCVPLIHRDLSLGALILIGNQNHAYSEHDLRAASLFAEHAAISVANARLYEAERALAVDLENRVEFSTTELEVREARFSALVRNSSDLVTIVDGNATILFQSPSITRILGWDMESTLGTSFLQALHDSDQERWHSIVSYFTSGIGNEVTSEWQVRHADGSWRYLQSVITDLTNEPSVHGFLLNSRDITDQKVLEDQLRHQAFHDSLTGLANRALFAEHLEQAIRRRGRIGGGLAVVFMDLDSFKAVNDLHGHSFGDEVLRQAAARLRTTLRDADAIARFGGDEFAVLFEGIAFDASPRAAVERLISAFTQPFQIGTAIVTVSATLGMALDEAGTESAEDLLRNADLAMYAAKIKNKGGYEVFTSGLHSTILDRMQVQSDLRRAVDNNEFEIYYQPIVDLVSESISGVEALIRWNHPSRGLVMPDAFIALAESTGAIVEIGNWVLSHACHEFMDLTEGMPGGEGLTLSVNLSCRQLSDPDLFDNVKNALRDAQLDARRLTLEVTESMLMVDVEHAVRVLTQLREIGVQIAIDDFGTGYSSLSLLNQIPVDTLKIDRTFVTDVTVDPERARMIRAILLLARDLRLHTVAEGVEQAAQYQLLRQLGCQASQGYYLATPQPASKLRELLSAGRPSR